VAVFAASRAIPPGRPPRYGGELITALLISFGAGLAATALDFGGWNEIDWRAALFVAACAFAALGCHRAVRLALRRVA
jgi:hypothetical protein